MRNHFLRAALASAGAGGGIVTANLILNLDAGNSASYPGTGTTWTDLSGQGNNGTLTNGVGYDSANSGSLVFDGLNDYVDVSGSTTVSAATFLAWIRLDDLSQTNYTGIIFSRSTNISGMNFYSGTENIGYTWNGALNTYNWNSGLTAPNQEWCMVAVTVTSSVATAYLFTSSGTTSATNSVSHGSTTLDAIKVGADVPINRYLDGKISVAMVYNKALTAAEVQQNYNALFARYHGLILNLDAGNSASYPGTGTTWTDLSGQGNNGTLINGVGYDSANSGSLVFDGLNDYVSETTGLSDSFLQGNWTISFWANWDVLSTANNGSDDRPLLQHGTASTNRGLHLTQRNSRIHFGLYGNDLQGTQILSTGTWYHIAFTLNNATYAKQIYIDGSLDNSHTGSGSYIGTGTNTRIGGKVLPFGNYFDGKISNVTAHPRVLTASEILQEYNALAGRY